MTKKIIKIAKKIRERAAKKWRCAVSEIDWQSCVALAFADLRGEKFCFAKIKSVVVGAIDRIDLAMETLASNVCQLVVVVNVFQNREDCHLNEFY